MADQEALKQFGVCIRHDFDDLFDIAHGCPKCNAERAAPAGVVDLIGRPLNDACWAFLEAMPHNLPGPVFNDLKPALRAAIETYLSASQAQAPTAPSGWKLLKDSTHDERSWPEDSSHENGNYSNSCCHCLRMFTGHKRRVVCKVCATEPSAQAPTAVQPESLAAEYDDAPKCRDCADFGPICPSSGRPCGSSAAHQENKHG